MNWTPERDAYVRKWTHLKTAAEISADLGCSTAAVHHRRQRLGICAIRKGQAHSQAKLKRHGAAMIQTLSDAGFMPADIHRLCHSRITIDTVIDVATRRTWNV